MRPFPGAFRPWCLPLLLQLVEIGRWRRPPSDELLRAGQHRVGVGPAATTETGVAELHVDAPATRLGVDPTASGDGHREHTEVELVDDLAVADGQIGRASCRERV